MKYHLEKSLKSLIFVIVIDIVRIPWGRSHCRVTFVLFCYCCNLKVFVEKAYSRLKESMAFNIRLREMVKFRHMKDKGSIKIWLLVKKGKLLCKLASNLLLNVQKANDGAISRNVSRIKLSQKKKPNGGLEPPTLRLRVSRSTD
ncbi:hypothetical protein BDF20DRAFT_986449 [Mycotypha africana]|uniref:uncharacterized protein n=1 Tax=Mycotypha africana TaxID=64632 RepID=UPI0022FFFF2C|nr:uncharacterized protein BDF20DRAFT_986449 [Mycotypha africana]KAI8984587.1 hypothetical protein BDF20DRAFT_986449 [Mycotypha africana]